MAHRACARKAPRAVGVSPAGTAGGGTRPEVPGSHGTVVPPARSRPQTAPDGPKRAQSGRHPGGIMCMPLLAGQPPASCKSAGASRTGHPQCATRTMLGDSSIGSTVTPDSTTGEAIGHHSDLTGAARVAWRRCATPPRVRCRQAALGRELDREFYGGLTVWEHSAERSPSSASFRSSPASVQAWCRTRLIVNYHLYGIKCPRPEGGYVDHRPAVNRQIPLDPTIIVVDPPRSNLTAPARFPDSTSPVVPLDGRLPGFLADAHDRNGLAPHRRPTRGRRPSTPPASNSVASTIATPP